jgi:imidazoleglycerol-phosphate dehydratase
MNRTAEIIRNTNETQVRVAINLDGTGKQKAEHRRAFPRSHAGPDRPPRPDRPRIEATGDMHIDNHHTVEDVGITLGMAVAKAIGDKKGIRATATPTCRWTSAVARGARLLRPPGIEYHIPFTRAMIGTFDVDLTLEFFRGFVNHALVTLHIDNLRGTNAHHQCETVFKAFGRALRMASELDPRAAGTIPSTKGSL